LSRSQFPLPSILGFEPFSHAVSGIKGLRFALVDVELHNDPELLSDFVFYDIKEFPDALPLCGLTLKLRL
jgi:hypothetical protein